MSIIIGIDFGTTKSSVGAWIKNKPIIVPSKNGRLSIPSEILIQGNGDSQEVFVGWDAQNKNKYKDDSFIVKSIKRMAGESNSKNEKWWYKHPQFTFSYILAELKCMAEEFFKEEINDAVITIPIHFDLNQRRAIQEAAKIAGLNITKLLNEPVASAIASTFQDSRELTVMIIDVGGGTTDIAIIETGDNLFDIVYVDGKTQLGGVDFNNKLYEWYLGELFIHYKITESDIDKTCEVIFYDEIERLKKELSENRSSKIYLPYIEINGHALDKEIELSQPEFQTLTNDLISEIVNMSKDAQRYYHNKENKKTYGYDPINTYLLMGGAGKTFGLKNGLKEELKIDSLRRISLETSVAIGAITQGAISMGKIKDMLVIDCTHDDYGIGLADNKYEVFIDKDTRIPTKKIKEFTTSTDNQTKIEVKIFKGSNPIAYNNKYVGKLELDGIPSKPKGFLKIKVEFDISSDMTITVSANVEGYGKNIKIDTTLKSEFGLSQETILEMQKKLSVWKSKRKAVH